MNCSWTCVIFLTTAIEIASYIEIGNRSVIWQWHIRSWFWKDFESVQNWSGKITECFNLSGFYCEILEDGYNKVGQTVKLWLRGFFKKSMILNQECLFSFLLSQNNLVHNKWPISFKWNLSFSGTIDSSYLGLRNQLWLR